MIRDITAISLNKIIVRVDDFIYILFVVYKKIRTSIQVNQFTNNLITIQIDCI